LLSTVAEHAILTLVVVGNVFNDIGGFITRVGRALNIVINRRRHARNAAVGIGRRVTWSTCFCAIAKDTIRAKRMLRRVQYGTSRLVTLVERTWITVIYCRWCTGNAAGCDIASLDSVAGIAIVTLF